MLSLEVVPSLDVVPKESPLVVAVTWLEVGTSMVAKYEVIIIDLHFGSGIIVAWKSCVTCETC